MEPPAPRSSRARARRRGDRGLGERGLAEGRKNARCRNAWICSQDESGFSLLPSVRAIWAPKGRAPALHHRFSWKRLSMSGVLGYAPDGSDAWLVFAMRPGACNEESLIEFLTGLRDELVGAKCRLLWDGLPSHRSKAMRAFLETQHHWLVVEQLPGYAHDLNPMDLVWGNLKSSELADLCPDAIDDVAQVAEAGLDRIGSDSLLCLAFLHHTGLSL